MDTKILRQKILDLAIHGRLVKQDANDEPASTLLARIRQEKEQLVKDGKLKKKDLVTTPVSDEDKPFEVPKGWEWCRLGEYFLLLSGQDFPPEKYNDTKDGIPYIIGASNISEGRLMINRWTSCPSVCSTNNDLLVVCKGAGVGKMAMNDIGTVHIARQIQAIRDVTQNVSMEFIKYVVSCNISDIIANANGLIPGLKRELLLSLLIPLPPLAEQQRIVAAVEQWMSLVDIIENGKENLQQSIALAKNKILDLAIKGKLVEKEGEWEQVTLKEIISLKSGDGLKVRDLGDNGVYPVYGGNGINSYHSEYNVEEGTLIIGRVGFYCGSIHKTQSKAWITDNALVVAIKKTNIDVDFLRILLIVLDLKKTSNSTAQPVVSGRGIYPLEIPLPPLSEQHRIVAKIEELFTQLDIISNALK